MQRNTDIEIGQKTVSDIQTSIDEIKNMLESMMELLQPTEGAWSIKRVASV